MFLTQTAGTILFIVAGIQLVLAGYIILARHSPWKGLCLALAALFTASFVIFRQFDLLVAAVACYFVAGWFQLNPEKRGVP